MIWRMLPLAPSAAPRGHGDCATHESRGAGGSTGSIISLHRPHAPPHTLRAAGVALEGALLHHGCEPYGGGSCGAKVVYICPVLSPTPFRLRINPTTRTVTYVTPHHTNTLTRQRGKADIAEASTTHRPVSEASEERRKI